MTTSQALLSGDNRASMFALDEQQQTILDQADRFAHKELYPLSERMDREEWWPDEAFRLIGDNGFFGATIPEEYGGAGLDLLAAGLVLQGFARWNHAMALSWVAHDNLCANNIYRNGNEQQRRKYLPDLCTGQKIGALGLTEPGAGSDALGSMRTTARRDGDHYVLNGGKIYITNGPVADVVLVYAKTDRSKGAHGISAFIVEKDFPGFKVAQKLTKMGYRGSQTAELVFEDCRVPVENLVGGEDRGVSIVMSGLDLERAMISPLCLGVSERALQLSIDYAQNPPAVRQAHWILSDGPVDAGRDVRTGRNHADLHLSHAGGSRAARSRRWRTRRYPHADGSLGDVRRRGLPCRPRQGSADPWRQRLHLGVGDQSTVSFDQAVGDRRRNDRSPKDDHRGRAAQGRGPPWLTIRRRSDRIGLD